MTMSNLLKLPRNKVLYSLIREEHYAYVDKTMFIERLEEENLDYPFIVRPRRFGKSLFTTMLADYYDLNKADKFDKLFSDTYIYEHKTSLQGKFRILNFDFSGLDTGSSLIDSFSRSIKDCFASFLRAYPVKGIEPNCLKDEPNLPATLFNTFCNLVEDGGRNIYIIIDEYDQFANEVLSADEDSFRQMTSDNGFLKNFYAAIKRQTKSVVAKVFITGVTSVSLDSISSGFNNVDNIYDNPLFSHMFGFTASELLELINKTVDVDKYGHSADEILGRMKDYFNGYRFCRDSEITVFNPSMCINYLQHIVSFNKEPQQFFDPNANYDISRVEGFMKLCGDEKFKTDLCLAVLTCQSIHMDSLPTNLNLNKIKRLRRNELLSVLVYMGYLTWSAQGDLDLCCPNKAVREQFFKVYFRSFSEDSDLPLSLTKGLKNAYASMHKGNVKVYLDYVSEMMTRHTSSHALSKFNEMVVQAVTQSYCLCSTDFKATSDAEALAKGYYDLLIEEKSNLPDRKIWLIEFKYLSIADGTASAIERKFQEAMVQAKRYASSEQFAMYPNLKYGAVVFVGTRIAKTSF